MKHLRVSHLYAKFVYRLMNISHSLISRYHLTRKHQCINTQAESRDELRGSIFPKKIRCVLLISELLSKDFSASYIALFMFRYLAFVMSFTSNHSQFDFSPFWISGFKKYKNIIREDYMFSPRETNKPLS